MHCLTNLPPTPPPHFCGLLQLWWPERDATSCCVSPSLSAPPHHSDWTEPQNFPGNSGLGPSSSPYRYESALDQGWTLLRLGNRPNCTGAKLVSPYHHIVLKRMQTIGSLGQLGSQLEHNISGTSELENVLELLLFATHPLPHLRCVGHGFGPLETVRPSVRPVAVPLLVPLLSPRRLLLATE